MNHNKKQWKTINQLTRSITRTLEGYINQSILRNFKNFLPYQLAFGGLRCIALENSL